MVAPLLIPICMFLAGSAVVLQQIVRPRLPVYKLSVRGIPLPAKSTATGEYKTAIKANVELFNANFLNLDVHALHFDVYTAHASNNSSEKMQVLRHIGSIQDQEQNQQPRIQEVENSKSRRRRQKTSETAVWSLERRSNFTTTSTLYMSTDYSAVFWSLSHLASRWWHTSGRLTLPTTGVVHIRAVSKTSALNSNNNEDKSSLSSTSPAKLKAPFTVSIICDNLVDTWKLQVLGLECAMYNMVPGWADMATTAADVREYATTKLPVNATGGILQHPSMSWEDVLSTIAWEESMQLL